MLNKATIIGNLGADVELRTMPNGKSATTITIATTQKWKDKQTGEKKEHTEWHRVALFDRSAEVAGEYLKKGSKVYVEGRLRTQKWTDQQGVDHYTTEIVGERLIMLDSKPQGYDQAHPASQHQPASKPQGQGQPNSNGMQPSPNYDNFDAPYDDDIPFS